MKSIDLMIGDWVVYDGDVEYQNPIRVEGMDISGYSLITSDRDDVGFDGVQPIPLTPEILEKNGFTNYGESWYIPYTEDCVMVGFHMYETTINISKDRVSFHKSIPCEYRSCYINRKVFVHELQHALRLCGIEKEITI